MHDNGQRHFGTDVFSFHHYNHGCKQHLDPISVTHLLLTLTLIVVACGETAAFWENIFTYSAASGSATIHISCQMQLVSGYLLKL